jgi:hypothetical protein
MFETAAYCADEFVIEPSMLLPPCLCCCIAHVVLMGLSMGRLLMILNPNFILTSASATVQPKS